MDGEANIGTSPKSALKKVPYDNYRIFHPDGSLMCFSSKKKAAWYLRNGLAVRMDPDDEFKIQLTFTPKGYGDSSELLVGRRNCCVISGEVDNLSKHHVIPSQYRTHFPLRYKDKNSCDLVVLSRPRHDAYEIVANDLKKRLFDDYVDADSKEAMEAWYEAKSLHNCIRGTHYVYLPPSRQAYVQLRYSGLMDRWGFTEQELRKHSMLDFKDPNKIIVDGVGVVNFIVIWKLHFIKYGKPKYLPDWWRPNLIKVIDRGMQTSKTEMVEVDMDEPVLRGLIERYDLL